MEVVQLIGAPLEAGFRELRLQEMQKQSCMINCCLGILTNPPTQTYFCALMTLFMQISTSQVGNWPYSFQSAVVVQWQLLTLWDIQRYAQDRFLEVSHRAQMSCSELLEHFDAEGEAFMSWIITGDETWLTITSQR
jgi:hypothetical protein